MFKKYLSTWWIPALIYAITAAIFTVIILICAEDILYSHSYSTEYHILASVFVKSVLVTVLFGCVTIIANIYWKHWRNAFVQFFLLIIYLLIMSFSSLFFRVIVDDDAELSLPNANYSSHFNIQDVMKKNPDNHASLDFAESPDQPGKYVYAAW
jgi:hypothetical protein